MAPNAGRLNYPRVLEVCRSMRPRTAAAFIMAMGSGARHFNEIQRVALLGKADAAKSRRYLLDVGLIEPDGSGYRLSSTLYLSATDSHGEPLAQNGSYSEPTGSHNEPLSRPGPDLTDHFQDPGNRSDQSDHYGSLNEPLANLDMDDPDEFQRLSELLAGPPFQSDEPSQFLREHWARREFIAYHAREIAARPADRMPRNPMGLLIHLIRKKAPIPKRQPAQLTLDAAEWQARQLRRREAMLETLLALPNPDQDKIERLRRNIELDRRALGGR